MHGVDDTRLEEFRQFKKHVRGSKEYLIVGIDVGKDSHNAFFGTSTGKTLVRGLTFRNDIGGFEKLLHQAHAVRGQNSLSKMVFGLEPTGNYHKPLGEHLIRCAHMVVLVSGNAVVKNRELIDNRWDKHDTKDAANIADLVGQGKCLFYEYPAMPLRNLRNVLSLKKRLKKQEQGIRLRIRNHLVAQYFPELDRHYGRCEGENLAIVRWCLNPSMIAGMEYEQFAQMITTRNRGGRKDKRLREIWHKAYESVGCVVGESVEFEATMLVEQLKRIREDIRAADKKIEQLCGWFVEYGYLLTIPGIGPVIAAKVVGAIGNPHRFNTRKEVLKLAGLDLSASRSGKTAGSAVGVISKKGKSDLRYALYQAALVASVRNPTFVTYFTNQLRGRERERGIKTKMRVKLAAKMLVIAWTLMKKKTVFDPSYLNQP
jgi:transposase